MVLLSNEDKEIWKQYTENMDKLRIKIIKEGTISNNKEKTNKDNKSYVYQNTFDKYLKLLNKRKIEPDGIIDLHGYNLKDAKINLKNYIFQAYNNNKRNILIITGKGFNKTGLLKKEVPIWLKEEEIKKIVINYSNAPSTFGGEGALIIRLRNKQKSSI